MNNEPVAWEGAEEWEHLAWELCADEHGEESCTDLIWTMDVIPEPWGDRWQKYEDEAKRMIAMVRKFTHPVKELTDEPMRKYVEDFATRCGWIRGGEGAFEYIQRKSYAQGIEDASVKELTNDEMRKVINEIVDEVTVSEMVTFLAISKAILRKAQEK